MPTQSTPSSSLHGGCQCGSLRYTLTGPILAFYACHCRHCQQQSASAFGLSYWIKAAEFEFSQGHPGTFETRGGSGAIKYGKFCEECGTRIFNRGGATRSGDMADSADDLLSVKGGTLDKIQEMKPVSHIWLRSALPWVREMIETTWPDMPCYEGEPDDDELLALWQRSGQKLTGD